MANGIKVVCLLMVYEKDTLKLTLTLTPEQKKHIEELFNFKLDAGGDWPITEDVFVGLYQGEEIT